MMQIEVIERYVDQVLEVNGMVKGTEEQLRLLLSHLYTAVGMYQLLDKDQKLLVAKIQKQLRHFFYAKCDLKERKSKKDKEKTPLHPSIKEKETKEKDEKTRTYAASRESFHQECLGFVGLYDTQLLSDFYNYWSEVNEKTGKMRFQEERYWSTERRLKRWVKNQYSSATTAAALRLEKAKKGKTKAVDTTKQQQTIAAERSDANDRLFQAIEENKRNAVSYEEWKSAQRNRPYSALKNSRDGDKE